MTRVSLDLDPVVLARLRAAANRRRVTPDQIANELLVAGLRIAGRASGSSPGEPKRPVTYDYDDGDGDEPEGATVDQ